MSKKEKVEPKVELKLNVEDFLSTVGGSSSLSLLSHYKRKFGQTQMTVKDWEIETKLKSQISYGNKNMDKK